MKCMQNGRCCGCTRRMCVAGWCCGIGTVLLFFGLGVIGGRRGTLIADVHDLMYIDDTSETDPGVNAVSADLASAVAESEQFKVWSMGAKEKYQECLKDNDAKDCLNGKDVTIAVFDVLNADKIISEGAKPEVQEVGPIYAIQYTDKTHIDKARWDKDGVAEWQANSSFVLHEKCGEQCKALLDKEVVIPSPVWGQLGNKGFVEVVGAFLAVGGTFGMTMEGAMQKGMNATDAQALAVSTISAGLGGLQPEEISPVVATFTDTTMVGPGGFLQTAMPAATKVGECMKLQAANKTTEFQTCMGEAMPMTCMLGAHVKPTAAPAQCVLAATPTLPCTIAAPRCAAIIQGVMTMWGGFMQKMAPLYGVSPIAAPFFQKVKVRNILGWTGSGGIIDPMLNAGLANGMNILANYTSSSDYEGPEFKQAAQMSSKYEDEGTCFMTQWKSQTQECRFDMDCKVDDDVCDVLKRDCGSTSAYGSCKANDECTPYRERGYEGSKWPGQLWGDEEKGSTLLEVGKVLPVFFTGLVVKFEVSAEKTLTADAGDLTYLEMTLFNAEGKVENCDGKGKGSPGIDCSSPKYTSDMGPMLSAAPIYLTSPYFDVSAKAKSNSKTFESQYDPLDKVTISKCKGNAWCDDSKKHEMFVMVEPNSGMTFGGNTANQFALRVGHFKTPLTQVTCPGCPGAQDALIPIVWQHSLTEAPAKSLDGLVVLQGAPAAIQGLSLILAVVGLVFICCTFVICIVEGRKA